MHQTDKDIALGRLKEILLSEDQQRLAELEGELEALQEQIADKESLIETLDPVIADVLDRKIVNSKDEFAEILAPVIGISIKRQVSEAKDDIVDALYPVIGKTIRKSVAEAMKNLVNSVNERIEQSLQSINIFQILKSKVTGVSQGELVLRQNMPFSIEEMYIIRKEKGLLIAYANANEEEASANNELFSGMIEAFNNFVSTITEEHDKNFDELKIGESNIILDVQNTFYSAVKIQGVMPKDFPEKLNALGHRIHNRFYKTIREFDGDPRPLAGCVAMMKSFMGSYQVVAEKSRKKSKPILLYFFILLLIAVLAFIGVKYIPSYLTDRQLKNNVSAALTANEQIYEKTIRIETKDGELILTGSVPGIEQRSYIDSVVRAIPDVKNVKNQLRILKSHAELSERIDLALTPFRAVSQNEIRYLLEEDRVTLEGVVPNPQTRIDISRIIGDLEGVNSVINNLSATRQSEKEELESFLESNVIYFDLNQKNLDEQHHRVLDYLAAKLMTLDSATLTIAGHSDNLSSQNYNKKLSEERAQVVAAYLFSKNLQRDKIQIAFYGADNPIATNSTEEGRSLNRRVEFTLSGS
jgi:outer membrane protein OmpA-like peptidoglycan-associated protein